MYLFMLSSHNLIRWIVLILTAVVLARAAIGWVRRLEWRPLDGTLGRVLASAADVQLLVGVVLYLFFSPLTKAAFLDMGAAMKNDDLRFFVIEHAFLALLAIVFVHLGAMAPRKVPEAVAKHRRAAIWYALALASLLATIPWGRPLFPGLG
jgi:hypothetical protein